MDTISSPRREKRNANEKTETRQKKEAEKEKDETHRQA